MLSDSQLRKLKKSKLVQLASHQIEHVHKNVPNMSYDNYKKFDRAYKNGKGVRIAFHPDELHGSGFDLPSAAKASKNFVVNESVNLVPAPEYFKKPVRRSIRKLTGGSVNPYMPDMNSMSGKGLSLPKNGVYDDSKNILRSDQDSFSVKAYNLPKPNNYNPKLQGRGFKVNM